MIDNGDLVPQGFQIFLRDAQARGQDIAGYGPHLLLDVLLAPQLLHLVEELGTAHMPQINFD